MTKAKARSRGGRPSLPPAELRDRKVNVAFSLGEHAQVLERALAFGMRPAAFLRETALSRRLPSAPVPAINRDRYVALARLSANFNQLAKHANAGDKVTINDALLQEMISEVGQLRLELVGIKR